MKNRARGPLDLISDVLLSIFDFERQYYDFHGFSGSGSSLGDNKSTEIDADNHIETMYRQNTIQSTICIKNDVPSPFKLHPKSLKIELGSPRRSSWRSWGGPGAPFAPQRQFNTKNHGQSAPKMIPRLQK